MVGYDGALNGIVLTGRASTTTTALFVAPPAAPEEERATLSVVRVTADGAASVYELQTVEGATNGVDAHTLIPDPRGGVHAEWAMITANGGNWESTDKHQRVGPGLSSAEDANA